MEGEKLFGHWQQQGEVTMSEIGSSLSMPHQGFLHINWDHQSMEQSSHFESALSSMVSSPSHQAPAAGDSVVIHELIGRLGSICNSGEISPTSHHYGGLSAAASCYSTPLNSPPKLNLSVLEQSQQLAQRGLSLPSHCSLPPSPAVHLAPFAADPRFVERAARLSAATRNYASHGPLPESGRLSRASSSKSLLASRPSTPEDMREESSVSGAIGAEAVARAAGEGNGRKRKAGQRGKGTAKDLPKVAEEDDAGAKKTRSSEGAGKGKDEAKLKEEVTGEANSGDGTRKKESGSNPPEPPKQDYIHVRARRGQATDSHSLAERVRREKISERMKFLQNLVPGCNKVTGKAVMLDEIINYVQSLQRQVEFLSMKLATLNPRLDFNMDGLLQKDMLQQRGSMPHSGFPVEAHIPSLAFPFPHQPSHGSPLQSIITNGMENHCAVNSMDVEVRPPFDGIAPPQIGLLWDDELHSFIQMNYSQGHELPFSSQSLQGSLPTTHMKVNSEV